MTWLEIAQVTVLVIRGVAWLVGNVKLFVRAYKLVNDQKNGWLQQQDQDDEFIIWRATGGLPELAVLERGVDHDAILDDLTSGRLGMLSDVLMFGKRDDCVEWVSAWVATEDHFIAVCTSNTDVIEDIGRRLGE